MFSVIIPAYNSEKTIEKTLNSLKNQTTPQLIHEVIVINDGRQMVQPIKWSNIKKTKVII